MEAVKRPALRVGIFTDSARQPRWIVEALARAGASGFAEITLVSTEKPEPGPGTGQVRDRSVPLLWRAYMGADQAISGRGGEARDDVTALVGLDRRLDRAGNEKCWQARVEAARLDVAFALGEVDIEALARLARHGAWSFCFGDSHNPCVALAAMTEALAQSPVISSGIRIHRAGQPDRVACRSFSRNYLSVTRSRATMFAKTADFLSRALRDLHAGGARWIDLGTEPVIESPVATTTRPEPQSMIRGITGLSTRAVKRVAEKALKLETWSIAYRFGGEEEWSGSLEGFRRLDPPAGWFWADPFPIERDGRYWIFFEELPRGAAKAHISAIEVRKDGTTSEPIKVLERPYHLSYPFLVEEHGRLYMIPETADNGTVEVYRCVEFPAKWELERTLLEDVRCVDATLHRESGRWWMFANAAAPGAEFNDELAIYSSDSLLGEWRPHRRNPVKSDVRSARPAGRLFRRGDGLYRPGQICTPLYGAGIALNRVTRLTADDYAEEEAARILPQDARTLGIHTFNRAGELTVADAFERRPRF